ncbi:MAG: VCBS repeat-containing protein, partial [Xanthomonadales bacterium]|nr:VCBS repeat-containing protein [Xanthomonadales bacterium]
GDVNGDGLDDVFIAALRASPNNNPSAGSSHVIYGRAGGLGADIALASLDGRNGFRLDGTSAYDLSGAAIGAGDINGDGLDDMVVGAPGANGSGNYSGISYVLYGERDRVFRDGSEDQNIDQRYPRLAVRESFIGSAVRWQNGATCHCDDPPFDLNLYNNGGNLNFFWPAAGIEGGVAVGGLYSVLQPGAVVGPASDFSTVGDSTATANWRAGADGYLGFRYVNADSGLVTYGYAHIRSTAPTGFPIEVLDVGVNLTGQAVTIPSP